jgi:hypothetical protein
MMLLTALVGKHPRDGALTRRQRAWSRELFEHIYRFGIARHIRDQFSQFHGLHG